MAAGQLEGLDSEAILGHPPGPVRSDRLVLGAQDVARRNVRPPLERTPLPGGRPHLAAQPGGRPSGHVVRAVVVEGGHRRLGFPRGRPVFVDDGRSAPSPTGPRPVGAPRLVERPARFGHDGTQEHQVGHRPPGGDDGDGEAAQGVPDQHHVVPGIGQGRHHHGGVVLEAGVPVLAGKVNGHGPMSEPFQFGGEQIPAPGAVPGTVHQSEGGHLPHVVTRRGPEG